MSEREADKMRYEVRYIDGYGDGIHSLSRRVLYASDDEGDAITAAYTLAHDYRYGTAVVDTEDRVIDWGQGLTDYSGEEMAECSECPAMVRVSALDQGVCPDCRTEAR